MNADGTDQPRRTNNRRSTPCDLVARRLEDRVHETDGDGNDEIFVMNADGTGQTR